jgi:putative membrane protein
MILRWLVAAVHLLALGIGLGAVVARAAALGDAREQAALRRAFRADTLWGVAAALWISTGLWRLFGGLDKELAFYVNNHAFWTKMGLLVLVLLLEIVPMVTLIRWRMQDSRGDPVDTTRASVLARISLLQAVLVVAMVLAATAMARGIGI